MLLNKFIEVMGLNLDESQEVEMAKIEGEIQSIVTNLDLLPFYQRTLQHLIERRGKTLEVYRCRQEAKEAFVGAVAAGDDLGLWRKAYHQAKLTAKEEQALLDFRLKRLIGQLNKLSEPLSIILALLFLARFYDETLKLQTLPLFVLLIKHILIFPGVLFDISYRLKLDLFSLQSPLLDDVLNAVKSAGVDLNSPLDTSLVDSNSLISTLLNKDNNAEILEKIDCNEVPEQLCCIISMAAMTDPVYSEQSPTRFERSAILEWLTKRNIHPLTNQPLYIRDLKRDFPLKRKVDAYTKKQLRKYERAQEKKALYQQFLFQPVDNAAVDDTLDVNNEEMLQSTFGQASNTYQEFVNTRFGI